MQTGEIKILNARGFGLIRGKMFEKDLFFSFKEILGLTFDEIREGDAVDFDALEGPVDSFAMNVGRSTGYWQDQEANFEEEIDPNEKVDDADEEIGNPRENIIVLAFRDLNKRLARELAANPSGLNHIEWRDLERIIAEAFSGLGFRVELMPGSKDGGKDVVLSYTYLERQIYYVVEIKHWRSGTRVGDQLIRRFVHVIARESRQGGLFLASNGYTNRSIECISEIDHVHIGLGANSKIVTLCRNYVKAQDGVWRPPKNLEEVIFEGTLCKSRGQASRIS